MDEKDDRIHQPERAEVGYCPYCDRVVLVENNHEMWPMIHCACGQSFPIDGLARSVRLEGRLHPSRRTS
jgi:hypothetical protein